MSRHHPGLHLEAHRTHRTGWLRAAVLGANDGIVSTASLLVGVAAASTSQTTSGCRCLRCQFCSRRSIAAERG